MEVNKGFHSTEIYLGRISAGGSVRGRFEYFGPRKDIEGISLQCGSCTTINEQKEVDGKTIIKFTYEDDHVPNEGFKMANPSGLRVTKNMYAFFNDGEPMWVDDPNNPNPGQIRNWETKERQQLKFSVDVDYE